MNSLQTNVNEKVVASDKKERERLRKRNERINLSIEEQNIRRRKDVDRKRKRISIETESERLKRLKHEATLKKIRRSNESSVERQDRLKKVAEDVRKKRSIETMDCEWPKPISNELKKSCLQKFVNLMSKESLLQSVCCICNRVDFDKAIIKKKFKEINGCELLQISKELEIVLHLLSQKCDLDSSENNQETCNELLE